MEKQSRKNELISRWNFEWPVLDVLLVGKSSIDLSSLSITSREEAQRFLLAYGYDLSYQADQRKTSAIYIEAINFISEFLMPKEWQKGLKPPVQLLCKWDVIDLLLIASKASENKWNHYRPWACAILRVMHTIAHIDELERLKILESAKDAILGRFYKACTEDESGQLWFGQDQEKIKITKIEWKTSKTRKSILLKLLHKPGNVSDSIYDLLGVRITTESISDALLIVKYLKIFDIIAFPNAIPSRARNTMVRLEEFRTQIETLNQLFHSGEISQKQHQSMIAAIDASKTVSSSQNPHSAKDYRSIQITCRQRVQYADPAFEWQKKMRDFVKKTYTTESKTAKILNRTLEHMEEYYQNSNWTLFHSIYFPFEVQIIDRATSVSIEEGDASHDLYKLSQIRTARRRILSEVLSRGKSSQTSSI